MRTWLVAVVLLAGCEKETQLAGVDKWNVKRTRMKDATGRCIPEKLPDGRDGAYCFGQKPMGIRGMNVDLDLYFGAYDPEATLVEIQMKVGGCRTEDLEAWMRQNFGAPFEQHGMTQLAWKNEHLFAAGFLPIADEPGRCLIRIVPATEPGRWAAIWTSPGRSER